MPKTIDARGLSCPQPVLLTLEAMKQLVKGQIAILVDTETARENVIRAAASQGWQASGTQDQGGEYQILLEKS